MKLITYNILDGGGERLSLIAQVINDESPDIVVINEANGFDLNDNERLVSLGDLIAMPHYHLAPSGQRDYHVAIYSKLPLLSIEEIHPLVRAGIRVVVSTSIGQVAIVGTHLSPYSEVDRLPEIELILSSLAGYNNRIILGDLNSLAETDHYQEDSLVSSFNDTQMSKFTDGEMPLYKVTDIIEQNGYVDSGLLKNSETINTVPTNSNEDNSHSELRLDYVFISENMSNRVISYEVVKNSQTEQASDHYPVVVELGI
jgi:exodeoxyribonuclease-3